MRFKARKIYGQSKENHCAFCGSIATQTTKEGLLVCRHHIVQKFEEIKCTCGSWLEQRSGKFGPYFNCMHCGNINFNKAMEMKGVMDGQGLSVQAPKLLQSSSVQPPKSVQSSSFQSPKQIQSPPKESFEEREKRIRREERRGKETTITSDDVEYFS